MSKTKLAPAVSPVEPFVMLPRGVLSSDAWRSLGINGRRLIDFLLLEHMGKAGKQNGKLKAPHRQLEAFGINRRFIADTIRDVEILGLVECRRAGLKAASTYTLTWLSLPDGTPASDYWRGYRNPELLPLSQPAPQNLLYKGVAGVPYKCTADERNLAYKSTADGGQTPTVQMYGAYKKDLTKGVGSFSKKVRGAGSVPVAAPRPPFAGKLRVVGGGHE